MSMMIQSGRFGANFIPNPTSIDPNDVGAGITLSNSNRTVLKTATNSVTHCLAKHGKTSGKWRFQVTVDTLPMSGGELGVGCVGPLYSRGSYQGADSQGGGMVSDGRQGTNGGFSASGLGAWAAGNIIDVYVDVDNRKIWFGKNGTIAGDPTAGTGGVTMGSLVRGMFPNLYMHGGNGQLTANFAGPFSHNLHPTYQAWSDAQTCDRDTFRAAMMYIRSPGYFAQAFAEFIISATSGGSNVLASATATARANLSGHPPSYVFDANSTTDWQDTVNGGQNQGPSWIAGDIGAHAARAARYLSVQARAGSGGEQLQAPTLFDLYFSSDAASWEKGAIGLTFSAFAGSTPGIIKELAIPAL